MNVLAIAEGLEQQRIVGEMRQQTQLDLRIVRHQQFPALARNESGADLAAQRGADGDVLQIGIRRRQPSGGRARLIEAGMQPAGPRVDQRGQGVDVRALELGELAVFQHLAHDLVFRGQRLQNVDRGGARLPLAVFHRRGQLQIVEQHVAQLLRRADVERPAGEPVDVRGEARDLRLHQRGEALQFVVVDADAGAFHARQHAGQREFDGRSWRPRRPPPRRRLPVRHWR